MPKETFFNLDITKRERITDVIIDEFHEYGFEKASISRIVEQAGIAKGSYYQYFEGKNDLITYLLSLISERKMTYLTHISEKEYGSFFDMITEVYVGALKFLKDNPKLAAIGDNFIKSPDEKLKEDILGGNKQKSNDYLAGLLRKGIEMNEIDPHIDVDFFAHLMTSLSVSLGDYCRNYDSSLNELDEDIYLNLVHQTVQLFRIGIGKNQY